MKIFQNWSGGKDSAYCLFEAQRQQLPVEALLTTVADGRVSMHGIPERLVQEQAKALGLPLHLVPIGGGLSGYEDAVRGSNAAMKGAGFTHVASGDLYLEDLRSYREALYARDGLQTLFPIWKRDTRRLMEDFMAAGFRAVIVCVNESRLDPSFCGRILDADFLRDLPPGVDPAGEEGEYHTFVFDGPNFRQPVAFESGAIVRHSYPAPKNENDCFTDPRPEVCFSFLELLHPEAIPC